MRRVGLVVALVITTSCARTVAPPPALPIGEVDPLPLAPLPAPSPKAPHAPTFETHSGDVTWLPMIPRAQTFAALALAGDEDEPLDIAWRIGPSRRDPDAPAGEEYPGLYSSPIELVLARGKEVRTIPLGEHSGSPSSSFDTYCARSGFTQPEGASWSHPDLPNLVAAFDVDTIQGATEVVIVLGDGQLHVLTRETSDGACPSEVDQGPFLVCADMKWSYLAAVAVSGAPRVTETILDEDAPFDCARSYAGQSLIAPSP